MPISYYRRKLTTQVRVCLRAPIAESRRLRARLVGLSRGILTQENFQIWMRRNAIFNTRYEVCLRKISLEQV